MSAVPAAGVALAVVAVAALVALAVVLVVGAGGVRVIGPVSYTHLDVYKRQAWDIDAPWLENILEGSDVSDYESLQYFQRQLMDSGVIDRLVAVSYTHLRPRCSTA